MIMHPKHGIIYYLSLALFCLISAKAATVGVVVEGDSETTPPTHEHDYNYHESSKETKYREVIADIPACQGKTPDLNKCLKTVIETMVVRLRDGDDDLNIPSLDPFILNRTRFDYSNGPVSGSILLKTIQVRGFGHTKIKNLNIDIQGDKVNFHQLHYVPSLQIVGSYKADVTINNIPLKPKGLYNVTLDAVEIEEKGDGVLYEKDNHKFLRLTRLNANPVPKKLNINATGIFPDPSLDDVFIDITNEYWRQIYRLMLPRTKRFWEPMFRRVINAALSTVPFDLFPK